MTTLPSLWRRPWLLMLPMLVLVLMASASCAQAQAGRQRVLAALPVLHALAAELTAETTIDAVCLPPGAAVPLQSQAGALSRVDASVFQEGSAVITLGSLWRADPLYAAARRHNLRIIDIDASHSWDASTPAVTVIRVPANDVPWVQRDNGSGAWSPYGWLGIGNALRMATIIAGDLARLSPPDAPRIAANLAALESRMRVLKADYAARLSPLQDLRVLSLADEFIYLYAEFGIYVDGWFVRQDVEWRDADRAALTQYLREHGIRVVVHKWQPDAGIAKAIADGGARLVILDAGNPGVLADADQRYEVLMRANLDALLAAFTASGGSQAPPERDAADPTS